MLPAPRPWTDGIVRGVCIISFFILPLSMLKISFASTICILHSVDEPQPLREGDCCFDPI